MNAQVLTQEQIKKIHQASIAILERVGVTVPHADMLKRLEAAGAKIDYAAQRAQMPEKLVTASLAQAGKQFTIYGRDLNKKAEFGVGKRNFNTIGGEAMWVDEIGGERRYPSLRDVGAAARFCDALSHVNIVGAMAEPHEVPVARRCVEVGAEMLRNTTKPLLYFYYDRASAKWLHELMIAVRGGAKQAEQYPMWYPFLEPISPLRFPFLGIDILYETSKLNLPVPIGPMAQMGMSAPATIAGTIAQENAEILAGVVITQMVRPGTAVCYGGICHAFDMRTTQMIFCGPEQAIFGVAMTQMGKSYGLPVYINVGLTDSKRPDAQAGIETALTLGLGAAAGADIFGHMGICGVDQCTSLDILVLQNQVIDYVQSMMRTIDISDETLGLDIISQVGPGGTFIDQEHTAMHFRKELWAPKILDREYYQAWKDAGALSAEDRCRQVKEDILNNHQPEPLPKDMAKNIQSVLEGARKELV